MALADAQYITYDEYIDKRNEQDHLLRVEFGKIHNRMDTFGIEIAVLKDDVAVLKDDVAVLKDDVAVLKDDGAELKVNFLRMEARAHNGSIHNPFLRIAPIPVYRLRTGPTLPTKFPATAYEFWKLKSPDRKQLSLLIYLAKFYDIQGYEHWEQADAASHSEGSEEGLGNRDNQTLEDAIERYPHMAVEVLASLIGLEEDHFTNFRARAAELREQPQLQATKRTVTTNLEETKRQKKDLPTLLQPPKSISSAIIKKKDLPRSQRSWKSSHSEPSQQTRLLWDDSDRPYVGPTLQNPQGRQIQLSKDLGAKLETPLGSPTEAYSDN
jgi:hypothetical protein